MPNIVRETADGTRFISIEDELMRRRTIFLTETVTRESAVELVKQLMFLESEEPGKEITLVINSPGGSVNDGLAVYDYIRLMSSPVRTVCVSGAESMGAILFLAGDKRELLPHSRIMIHDPHYSGSGATYEGKKPNEIEEDLENLRKISKVLCEIIAERTGKPLKSVQAKTRQDSYFSAEEAVEFGLATGIITSVGGEDNEGRVI
ncbi:MAG: ATP-dependent Clp protease proteolytic subunit [Ruminococcus sp.]|nr:ATP-dependent Clp protease proteolytic subunit [Ruminococcus sp.]